MPINIAKPMSQPGKNSARIFNSSPLNLRGVEAKSVEQVSYNKMVIECDGSAQCLLNHLKNSNPTLNFGIVGDPVYDAETSKLIHKPDEPLWVISEDNAGKYTVQLA